MRDEAFVPKGRILIIEDNETLGKRTKAFLETRGHQVTWIPEAAVFAGMGNEKKTVSIAVAAVPAEGIDTPDKLIQAADTALYEAKKKGRNRIDVKM